MWYVAAVFFGAFVGFAFSALLCAAGSAEREEENYMLRKRLTDELAKKELIHLYYSQAREALRNRERKT